MTTADWFTSSVYTIDPVTGIGNVQSGTDVSDFLSKIVIAAPRATAKVEVVNEDYSTSEVTTGPVLTGYKLVVTTSESLTRTYNITVNP